MEVDIRISLGTSQKDKRQAAICLILGVLWKAHALKNTISSACQGPGVRMITVRAPERMDSLV